jgi:hypothetical protein
VYESIALETPTALEAYRWYCNENCCLLRGNERNGAVPGAVGLAEHLSAWFKLLLVLFSSSKDDVQFTLYI